jgi:hypothetical protein
VRTLHESRKVILKASSSPEVPFPTPVPRYSEEPDLPTKEPGSSEYLRPGVRRKREI